MAGLAYKWVASIALIFSLVLLAGIWHMGSNSMIACGFFGAFFIFAWRLGPCWPMRLAPTVSFTGVNDSEGRAFADQ